MSNKTLQWHAGFQAVLQIELAGDKEKLRFLEEYNLSKKPLQMDTLVIKKEGKELIRKNLGQIFRKYNIIEYKSPEDYLSINDFYKVMSYACLYQAETEHVLEVSPDELTITMVCSHYPLKLMKHLKARYQAQIKEAFPGIYYIDGLMFPLQLAVTRKLAKEENKWMSRLETNLGHQDAETLAEEYKGKEKDPLYVAAMDLIVRANHKLYEEEKTMCQALREIFQDEFKYCQEEGMKQGMKQGLEQGLEQGIRAMICSDKETGVEQAVTIQKLEKYFSMSQKEAEEAIKRNLACV